MPKKELAQSANPATSNTMDLLKTTNNVFGVDSVKNDLFGNVLMLKNVTNFLGSNFGFKKAIPSEDSHSFPDTAHPKSDKSKIIGLASTQQASQTFRKSSTFFATAPISEDTNVLWLL